MDVWTAGITPSPPPPKRNTPVITQTSPKYAHSIPNLAIIAIWSFYLIYLGIPIIICLIPVVKMNEQSVVDHSGDGCYADQGRVLSVHRLQLHPCSKPRRRHRLKEKEEREMISAVLKPVLKMDGAAHILCWGSWKGVLVRVDPCSSSHTCSNWTPHLYNLKNTLSEEDCLDRTQTLHVRFSLPLGSNNLCPFFSHQPAGFRSHESALAQKS